MNVRRISIDGRSATWRREGDELVVRPRAGLRKFRRFKVVIGYSGVPETIGDPTLGDLAGFVHTDDGTLVAGQPDAAATWYPVNDHPLDKAAYTFHITVPAGLEAVANGVLKDKRTRRGETTWTWKAREPMASYLTTATIGEFDLDAYREDGIRYWDAIDPDLYEAPRRRAPAPSTRSRRPRTPPTSGSTRTITVPAGGAEASFWVFRDTEPNWDYLFVEAGRPGTDDWTTLPDRNGHTSQDTGNVCPYWLDLHPFLAHYQTATDEGCDPRAPAARGTRRPASATATSSGRWTSPRTRAARSSCRSATPATTSGTTAACSSTTSSSPRARAARRSRNGLDGWTVPGAPAGTEPNENDWVVGGAEAAPPSVGELAAGALARQPEIIAFLEGVFGPYPFNAAGGIVDDVDGLGFALEIQTRPIYSKDFFSDRTSPVDSVVVHELAHQWAGDHLALAALAAHLDQRGLRDLLRVALERGAGPRHRAGVVRLHGRPPRRRSVVEVVIGDPGPELIFDGAVYDRGAATLHALRLEIGDADFFRLLRRWTALHGGGNVVIGQFTALAERVSGEQLDAFFDAWLFTGAKPAGLEGAQRRASASETSQSSRRAAGSYATWSARASRRPTK